MILNPIMIFFLWVLKMFSQTIHSYYFYMHPKMEDNKKTLLLWIKLIQGEMLLDYHHL